ncbi:unnamed protein product, partial [Rotaria magnacalcarata]
MEENIEGLVDTLTSLSTTTNTKLSDNLYSMITNLLQELDIQFLYKFISENFHSLCTLEHWAWKMLSENSNELLNQSKHIKLFHNLGTFNKNLIFNSDEIDSDKKASLLFPESIDLIDGIFAKMQDIN